MISQASSASTGRRARVGSTGARLRSEALLELAGGKPSCYVPCSQLDLTAALPLEVMHVLSGQEWSSAVALRKRPWRSVAMTAAGAWVVAARGALLEECRAAGDRSCRPEMVDPPMAARALLLGRVLGM